MSGYSGHDQVPDNAADGDRFVCSCCGASFVFVDLNDGQPGEWVGVTPPEFRVPSTSEGEGA